MPANKFHSFAHVLDTISSLRRLHDLADSLGVPEQAQEAFLKPMFALVEEKSQDALRAYASRKWGSGDERLYITHEEHLYKIEESEGGFSLRHIPSPTLAHAIDVPEAAPVPA